MLGLYIHIPFCAKKCHYCNFVITTRSSKDVVSGFLENLDKEIRRQKKKYALGVFDTLYLGGGTPSRLGEDGTRRLFDLIHKHFSFKSDAESTVEANPADLSGPLCDLYKKVKINRVSLGAQSFQDALLQKLNRDHTAADTQRAMDRLRAAGIFNISIDIILSLPGQTKRHLEKDLAAVGKLKPSHVSLYELVIEEKTAFSKWLKEGRLRLPSEERSLEFLTFYRASLSQKGYEHYELLSYAIPGAQSKHNKLYWANEPYLGLGPGAFSYLDGERFQLASSVLEYNQKIQESDWAYSESEKLSAEEKMQESFILALRLMKGADLSKFRPLLGSLSGEIAQMKQESLLIEEAGHLHLTEKGNLFAETVFSRLSKSS